MIESVFPYSVLMDKENICIFFIFICKPSYNVPNKKFRDVLFEVIINNKILNGFYISREFWHRFNVRNKDLRKKLSYFATENIDDPCIEAVVVNPTEYFEQFESGNVNKL